MTTQNTIDAARIFIAARMQRMGPGELADALADAGLLGEPKCAHECEALRDWDALVAERDEYLDLLKRGKVIVKDLQAQVVAARTSVRIRRAICQVAEDERDDIAGRLSELLCDLTGGKLSKTNYDVPTMAREVESEFEKYAQEDRRQIEAERDAALAKLDRVRGAAHTLALLDGAWHSGTDSYRKGRRDAYDLAEQLVRDAFEDPEASETCSHQDSVRRFRTTDGHRLKCVRCGKSFGKEASE